MTRITPIPAFNDNYIWVILHQESKHTIVVDPGDATPVIQHLEKHGLTLSAILITHHHWDHTGGIEKLLQYAKVPVYGPANDPVSPMDYPLGEDDQFALSTADCEFRVLDIPGHTSGHIAYVGLGGVFCGDTLFASGCGRLFEGTPEQMVSSLKKLSSLPGETMVYCAHEYTAANLRFAATVEPNNPDIQARIEQVANLRAQEKPSLPSTIATERQTNPFLRCHIDSVQQAVSAHCGRQLNDVIDVFAELRKWKDGF